MSQIDTETPVRGAEEALAYWAAQTAAAALPLDLPLDHARPAVPGGKRRRLAVEVSPPVAAAVERLARQEGTESSIVLLSAFLALLGRAAGQSEVAAGVPAGAGLLPVRARLAEDLSFRGLLRQVRDTASETAAHADLPADVLEGLAGEGRLFRAAFVPSEAAVPAGLDLALAVHPEGAGWAGLLDADAELFDAPTPGRLLAAWSRVLAAGAADPELRLPVLPWLSEAELHQVVREWNDTAVAVPEGVCLHHLTEAAARHAPGSVAWTSGRDSLTWGELDRRANQLAHRLRRLGVGPEVLVGVFLQRSLPLLVTLLGIHKAGGAYVPLDPDYPAERLAFMLADSGARVLVTQQDLLSLIDREGLETIVLDPAFETLAGEPIDRPAVEVAPDNLAYLIYTSGSTGRPKGVAIRHRGGVVLLRWATGFFSPADGAGVLFSTSISFDVSIFELFLPSILGTMGILARHALGLIDVPDPERVTLVSTAPSAMAELVRLGPVPSSVKAVALAGEALPIRLVEDLYRIPTIERVWNLYGPTEDTTYSTYSLVPRQLSGPPTIGRPLAGGRVHLLDAAFRPAPLGVRGEIYLGGEGLARGYFGRPELTAERFVPDPFGFEPGARLYRTGDLGRYRPDGEIEYLGRVDQQVKIRGLRIEPGEIEAVLARCPGVAEVAVAVQQRRTGPQLVAFYATAEGQHLPEARLRRAVQSELPSFMVPGRFVSLERLPITPNGKVDRRSLALIPTGEDAESELVPPRTRLELELRQVWEEVLQVAPISVTDNFFSLGGNSLLAIYLMICVRARFGRDLPGAVLLQHSTIEQFARVLEKESPELGHPSLVPLQRQGGKTPFFCIHDGAGGTIFRLVELARHLAEADPQRPFWGLQARGLLGEGEPLESIEEMADYYIEAIRTLQPEGPYHIAGYAMGGIIAYEMALRLSDRGEQVGLLAMIDAPPRPASRLPAVDLGRLTLLLARDLSLPIAPEDLAGLSQDEALSRVVEAGIRAHRIPREFTPQDARRYLRLMEAIVGATRRYQIERIYPGTLTVFEGQVLTDGLDGCWEELPVTKESIPISGNHRTMFERPQVEALAAALRDALDRAGAL